MVEVKRQSVVPLGVVVARGFAEYGVGLRRSLKEGKENRDEQQIFKTTGVHIIYFLAVISVCIYLLIGNWLTECQKQLSVFVSISFSTVKDFHVIEYAGLLRVCLFKAIYRNPINAILVIIRVECGNRSTD